MLFNRFLYLGPKCGDKDLKAFVDNGYISADPEQTPWANGKIVPLTPAGQAAVDRIIAGGVAEEGILLPPAA